jgi:hypothetical protein
MNKTTRKHDERFLSENECRPKEIRIRRSPTKQDRMK